MARYEIVFHNGYGREIDSMVVEAPSIAVALTLSGNLLLTGAVRNGEQAVSAAVELVGVYDQERPGFACVPDESAGQRDAHEREEALRRSGYGPDDPLTAGLELHSVRHELREIDRPDVGRAERLAAELRAELAELDDPSTGRS